MNISLDMDTKELRAAFHAAPVKVASNLNAWIYKTTLRTEREAKKNVPPNVDTGQLESSIHSRISYLLGEVKPTAKHALYVHEGRRPGGRMPPWKAGTPLNRWATKRGMNPFLVARGIAKHGTKPNRFMDKAYLTVKPVAERDARDTLQDIVRAI